MIRTRTWVLILCAVVLASCAALLLLGRSDTAGTSAVITIDGEVLRTVELNDSFSFVVEGEVCSNTIEVEPGRIRVSEAGCPDQVCVDTGWISTTARSIICLPNRLVIEIRSDEGGEEVPDAISQ